MQSEILSEKFQILLRKLLEITSFLLFAPFFVIILMFLHIYRRLIEIVLRIQLRDKFAGLLEGSDALWSVEDTSLSLITAILIVKKTAGSTNTIFLKNIRKFFTHLSKTVPKELDKLFYYRYQKFGYFYWEKSKFNPETAIRWLECEISNCDGSCENVHSTTFQENLGFICNQPLYDNHKPMWEMLIGRRCSKFSSYMEEDPSLSSEDRFNTDVDEIPVVFRVHHSLGDGIALLKMLSTVIADDDVIKEQSTIMLRNSILIDKKNNFKEKKILFSKTKIISNLKQVYNKTKKMILILFSLKLLISQIVRSTGKSSLYSQPLTGEKLIFCLMENDANKSLLMKIKKIKQYTGTRFNDIVITAFAAGVVKYYSRIKEVIPDAMSVFIPIRMSMPDEKVMLSNDFSFLMIKSCFVDADKKNILTVNKTACRFLERLQKTASINNRIRNSLEASVNFFFLKHVSGLLPAEVLRYCTEFFCTMVFSNVMGMPKKIPILKHSVDNILFSIPNRGITGLGLTTLTYDDKINLCLVVDKAIIKNRKLITEILKETVREIDYAYNSLA
ncbi:uncharacterized protein LOC109860543 isoform X1 [Pseudomyrmex gracilis]|uniref:uncharacterized protein LOC109860543 isoform X1 n=1 Tax=Pseudomyrmex gracilis TaxID=219809 RepID=UPI00099494D9|nr:uncharacterized protein LOC109860543 isoform X1 [Pseudomyrmex gracilis]